MKESSTDFQGSLVTGREEPRARSSHFLNRMCTTQEKDIQRNREEKRYEKEREGEKKESEDRCIRPREVDRDR